MTATITCPKCGRTSTHPQDIAEGYCGNCHAWTTGPPQTPRGRIGFVSEPLTVDRFIAAFRLDSGWKCEAGTRITNELTAFAQEREGSRRNILELLVIFKMSHDLPTEIRNAAAIEALGHPEGKP